MYSNFPKWVMVIDRLGHPIDWDLKPIDCAIRIPHGSSPKKKIKMLHKMVQHLSHTSNLPHMDYIRLRQGFVIEGKVDSQSGGPPNFKQPVMVQMKELKDYGILSHMSGVLF